jgi:hypothetical protein
VDADTLGEALKLMIRAFPSSPTYRILFDSAKLPFGRIGQEGHELASEGTSILECVEFCEQTFGAGDVRILDGDENGNHGPAMVEIPEDGVQVGLGNVLVM